MAIIEDVFLALYSIEMGLKILGMGFIFNNAFNRHTVFHCFSTNPMNSKTAMQLNNSQTSESFQNDFQQLWRLKASLKMMFTYSRDSLLTKLIILATAIVFLITSSSKPHVMSQNHMFCQFLQFAFSNKKNETTIPVQKDSNGG